MQKHETNIFRQQKRDFAFEDCVKQNGEKASHSEFIVSKSHDKPKMCCYPVVYAGTGDNSWHNLEPRKIPRITLS